MTSLSSIAHAFVANWETISAILVLIAYGLQATRWGQAHRKALDTVVGAIETAKAGGVKALVTEATATMEPNVQRAVANAVDTVSVDKATPPPVATFLKELVPGLATMPPGETIQPTR